MLKSGLARACRFCSRPFLLGRLTPTASEDAGRSSSRTQIQSSAVGGGWSFHARRIRVMASGAATAPLRAVFAPNRPLNDSAFPKSSGSLH